MAPVILLALTVHEYFHAWTAHKLGDNTAKAQGRLSLNPLVHLDIFGTIMIFIVGFGWAKPVPVDTRNFEDPRKGLLYVAIAGPLSNIGMAIIAGALLRYMFQDLAEPVSGLTNTIIEILYIALSINVALAVFNMIPLPPLDGSRVIFGLLPPKMAYSYSKVEPYGIFILFGLFFFGGTLFHQLLWYPIKYIMTLILGINLG